MSGNKRCDACGKVQHESLNKAQDVARRTRSNNLNDKRIFNAFRCEELGCRAFIVGTNDQAMSKATRLLGRKPDGREEKGKGKQDTDD